MSTNFLELFFDQFTKKTAIFRNMTFSDGQIWLKLEQIGFNSNSQLIFPHFSAI